MTLARLAYRMRPYLIGTNVVAGLLDLWVQQYGWAVAAFGLATALWFLHQLDDEGASK